MTMEEDELERPVESVTSPIAYDYEPIRRGNRAVVREEEVIEPVIEGVSATLRGVSVAIVR